MTQDIKRTPRVDTDDIIGKMTEKIADLERRLSQLEAAPADGVEVKTTAGDFASGWDGRRMLNTADNKYKIYADGAWRQLIAY